MSLLGKPVSAVILDTPQSHRLGLGLVNVRAPLARVWNGAFSPRCCADLLLSISVPRDVTC